MERNELMVAPAPNKPGELQVVAETDEIAALSLEGDFDLANASRIVEEGERLLADKHLIVDVSEATFIDSTVIEALLRLHEEAARNGRVAVLQAGTTAAVELAIGVSGIDRVMARTATRPEAIHTIHRLAA
jgi:anti-anti-sigma factor